MQTRGNKSCQKAYLSHQMQRLCLPIPQCWLTLAHTLHLPPLLPSQMYFTALFTENFGPQQGTLNKLPNQQKSMKPQHWQHFYSKTVEHLVWGSLTAFQRTCVMLSGQCMPCMLSKPQHGSKRKKKLTFNLACVCQSLTALLSLCSTLQLHVPWSSPECLWKTIQAC